MTVDNYITALENIRLALSEVVGALKAEKFKAEREFCQKKNPGTTAPGEVVENISKFPIVLKGENEMFTLKDTHERFHKGTYEVRFCKFGYYKTFCNKDLLIAQKRMQAYLRELNKTLRANRNTVEKDKSFEFWNELFLNKYKKPKLKQKSFENVLQISNAYVLTKFKNRDLRKIKPIEIQEYLIEIINSGKSRTAEDVKSYLNGLFEVARKNDVISKNPLEGVEIPKHYRKHGSALTLEEEYNFIQDVKGNYYEKVLLFCLYSGTRISEATKVNDSDIDFKNNTITIYTTKQKDKINKTTRIIPIFPKLKKVLLMPGKLNVDTKHASKAFKKVCPNHHLHELRHTFTTRCREYGIDLEITSLWTGHTFSGNTTSLVYTHFSMEKQQEMAKLLDYKYNF